MKIESHHVMVAGIVLLATMAAVATFYALSRPTSWRYSGTVESVEEWGFVVDGDHRPAFEVLLTDETRLLMGRVETPEVAVGDFVVVLGQPDDKGRIRAVVVRVINDHEFRR